MIFLKKIIAVFCLVCLSFSEAWAAMADYAAAYDIDFEKDKLPTLEELQKFFDEETVIYDPKYHSVWDLGNVFDSDFQSVIQTYGASEKRLKPDNEEIIMTMLKAMPRKYYEYFGPMLFQVPTMSEKVLNLAGIRGTKNRFPSRIAEQLKDVEDLEFLSPQLYFLLMPEMWETEQTPVEIPAWYLKSYPKVYHNPQFYEFVKTVVPPEKYMPGYEETGEITRSDMRTVSPKKTDLLTSEDVKAFIRTIDNVQGWLKQGRNLLQVYQVAGMMNLYETHHPDEKSLPLPQLKDLVNPCQRLVQKVMIMGREVEFARAVVDEGFTLSEWAYTCDKTLKAYRVSHISLPLLQALKSYQSGSTDYQLNTLSPHSRDVTYATMQGLLEMYKAPLSDVMEVRKNRKALHDSLEKYGFEVFGVTSIGRKD